MDFFGRLGSVVGERNSALCVGLDPRPPRGEADPAAWILRENRRLIEATAPYAACFKPNLAFYEAWGAPGLAALAESLALVPEGIPVLLDAKRCDIDATAEAYAEALFDRLGADAVTLSPYMGRDAALPFLAREGKGLFLLCRTSNPGAGAFQDLELASPGRPPEPLYLRVARECLSWSPSIGLVVAGNDLAALRAVREAAPEAWFLSPGIGAQGGDPAAAFAAGAREDGLGILVVASRSVAEAADPAGAARELRDRMNAARGSPGGRRAGPTGLPAILSRATQAPAPTSGATAPAARAASPAAEAPSRSELVRALVETGCFTLGDFVLKSGKKSPFYLDLRRLVSDPRALALAGRAYAALAAGLSYDRIAGIPAAALPLATAASLAAGRPMVWPRMPAKEHGTGRRVEGDWKAGERILLLDDLITTGASKLEALEILRGEGLVVEDLVVLVERGREGRADMAAAGLALHAFVHVREILRSCEELGMIDAAERARLEAFVDSE